MFAQRGELGLSNTATLGVKGVNNCAFKSSGRSRPREFERGFNACGRGACGLHAWVGCKGLWSLYSVHLIFQSASKPGCGQGHPIPHASQRKASRCGRWRRPLCQLAAGFAGSVALPWPLQTSERLRPDCNAHVISLMPVLYQAGSASQLPFSPFFSTPWTLPSHSQRSGGPRRAQRCFQAAWQLNSGWQKPRGSPTLTHASYCRQK